jgi:type IV secretory pathway TraG/TraD family ATPase VirD4
MSWHSLTHGTHGLIVAYALTLAPLVVTVIVRRAGISALLMTPILALPCALVGALVASLVAGRVTGGALQAGTGAAVLLLVGVAGGLLLSSRLAPAEAHHRGTVIAELAKAPAAASGAVTLAGVEIPLLDETKHFKLIGTTGSGKSTAIRELLTGALTRGDRAIIADPDGAYLGGFHDAARGDAILNPFDKRSVEWDLFGEIEKPYDIEHLARSLISDGSDPQSREWRGYARTFLSAILEYCKLENRTELAEVWRLVAVADPEELKELLAGTSAQPFLAEGAAKMFHSIRGTASPALAALRYVKGGSGSKLSVRQWVRTGKGVLFLPYEAGQITSLRDLISTWLRLAIFETMNGGEGDKRLWFVIDELDALGQIDGLKDALARLRKFGGRCVLGFQSIAQVRGTYGDAEAQTIVENCGNTLILRCSASEKGGTAEFASRLIGQREIVRTEVSHTRRRGHLLSDSATTSRQHVTEDAVMASEIEQLPDLAGFLKLATRPEWCRVQLSPVIAGSSPTAA